MFEATLRAVSERRSDRLDDISVDNVEMDARWRNTDMERMKAEAERDALKDAVESQAEMVVNLVGIVGRCTVMIGEAGRLLRSSVEEGRDGMEGTVCAMAALLKNVTEKNEAFTTMIGHSTVGHMRDERSALAIVVFKGHPTSFMRISSAPHLQPPKPRSSRRSLSYGGPGSPYRTPRKSLRSSISQPYRRGCRVRRRIRRACSGGMRLVRVIWMMVDSSSSSSYFLLRRRLWHADFCAQFIKVLHTQGTPGFSIIRLVVSEVVTVNTF